MQDVTALLSRYRECARMLWNSFLREDADYQTVDVYEDIRRRLFDEIVLAGVDKGESTKASPDDAYEFLRVVPRAEEIPIMINRSSSPGSGYWDDPVDRIGATDAELHLIDFFDWEQMGYRDFHYYRVRIENFTKHPDLNGRQALVEVHHAGVFLEAAPVEPAAASPSRHI